jgi:hypothetical protein
MVNSKVRALLSHSTVYHSNPPFDLIIYNRTRSNFSLSLGKSDSLSREERRGGGILIANVFGSRGEGRGGMIKLNFFFILIILVS